MKYIPLLIFACWFPLAAFAQVAVNGTGADPDPSAMLDVTSTNSGVLIPRMTLAQRNAIPSPATGLMIYCTTDNLFHFYNGTQWTAIDPSGGGSGPWVTTLGGDTVNNSPGNTGIGLTNPDAKLHVSESNTGETNGIKLTQGSYSSLLYHGSDGDMILRRMNQTNQLVLDADGSVGVGTPSPARKLEVSGEVFGAGGVRITSDETSFTEPAVTDLEHTGEKDFVIRNASSSVALDPAGRVGINALNPARALDVRPASGDEANNGISIWSDGTGSNSASIRMNGDRLVLQPDAPASLNALVLDPQTSGAAHVGINTLFPEQDLDVDGNAQISGTLDVGYLNVTGEGVSITAGAGNLGDLAVSDDLTISGGSPAAGKVLTAVDSDGLATWQSLPTAAGINSATAWQSGESASRSDGNNGVVGPRAALSGFTPGDLVLAMATFRCSLKGIGSGNDNYEFRFEFDDGAGGTNSTLSTTTGAITMIDQHRDDWLPVTVTQVAQVNWSGTVRCGVVVNRTTGDDQLYLSNIRVTAIVLK